MVNTLSRIILAISSINFIQASDIINDELYDQLSTTNFTHFSSIPKNKELIQKIEQYIENNKNSKIIGINSKNWNDAKIIRFLKDIQELKIKARIKGKYGYTKNNSFSYIRANNLPKDPYPIKLKLSQTAKSMVYINYNGYGKNNQYQTGNNAIYDIREEEKLLTTYPTKNSFNSSAFKEGLSNPSINLLILNEISRRLVVEKLKNKKRYDKFKDLPVGVGVSLYKNLYEILEDKPTKQEKLNEQFFAKDGKYHMFSAFSVERRKTAFIKLFKYSIKNLCAQGEIDIDRNYEDLFETESTASSNNYAIIMEYINESLNNNFKHPEYT